MLFTATTKPVRAIWIAVGLKEDQFLLLWHDLGVILFSIGGSNCCSWRAPNRLGGSLCFVSWRGEKSSFGNWIEDTLSAWMVEPASGLWWSWWVGEGILLLSQGNSPFHDTDQEHAFATVDPSSRILEAFGDGCPCDLCRLLWPKTLDEGRKPKRWDFGWCRQGIAAS